LPRPKPLVYNAPCHCPPDHRWATAPRGVRRWDYPLNDYEVTYILRPSLEEADVDERATAIAALMTGQGGEIVATEKLGKKRLAYEIADLREGWYVAMHFKSNAAASKELERLLKLNEDVLRALVIRLDKRALAGMAAAKLAMPPAPASSAY